MYGGSDGKGSACKAGDPGSTPLLGRSPREGRGNPLQYSCLENPMDRGAWWATVHGVEESWARLSNQTLCMERERELEPPFPRVVAGVGPGGWWSPARLALRSRDVRMRLNFQSLGLVREPNSSAKFYYDLEKSGVFWCGGGREWVISLLWDRFHLPNIRSEHEWSASIKSSPLKVSAQTGELRGPTVRLG